MLKVSFRSKLKKKKWEKYLNKEKKNCKEFIFNYFEKFYPKKLDCWGC